MREAYPNGPTAHVWRNFAHDEALDFDLALVAYRRCRREHLTLAVSCGAFWQHYCDARRDAARDRARMMPPPRCELCDGDGWAPGADEVHNAGTDREYRTTTSQPCICSEGEARRPVFERINDERRATVA